MTRFAPLAVASVLLLHGGGIVVDGSMRDLVGMAERPFRSLRRALGNGNGNSGNGKGNQGGGAGAGAGGGDEEDDAVDCVVERIIGAPKDPERGVHSDGLYCVTSDENGKSRTLEISGLDAKSEEQIRAALDDGAEHTFRMYGARPSRRGRNEWDRLEVPTGGGKGKRKGQIKQVGSSARYEKGTGARYEKGTGARYEKGTGRKLRGCDPNVDNHCGDFTVLALRVSSPDCPPIGSSAEEVRDKIFGGTLDPDGVDLATQTESCSHGKMTYIKATNDETAGFPALTTDGVLDVFVSTNLTDMSSGSAVDEAYAAAIPLLNGNTGVTNMNRFDYVEYLMPSCVAFGSAAAWAYVPGQVSAYDGGYGLMTWVQMHEVGHNIGLLHSGKDGAGYGDSSGYMGAGSLGAEPKMCYNAAKSWYLGWYKEFHAEYVPSPTSPSWSGTLSSLTDYQDAGANDVIVLRIETFENQKLYLTYNRGETINADTQRFGDTVTVVRADNGGISGQSWNEAALLPGEDYSVEIVAGSGLQIEVRACEHIPGAPDQARISIVVLGQAQHSCEYVPPPRWPQWPAHSGALSDGMVGYYTFDDDYVDSSGLGHDAQVGEETTNDPTFVTDGAIGSALSLDGVDDYVRLPNVADFNFGSDNDFTLTFWYRTSDDQSSDPVVIGNKNWASGSNTGWVLTANGGSGSNGDDLRFSLAVSGSGRRDTPSIDVAFDAWHFVFLRVDRTDFYDATLCRSSGASLSCLDSMDISAVVGSLDAGMPIHIGQDGTGAYPDSTLMDIDDLGIWRRALSEAELMDIYHRGLERQMSILESAPPTPPPSPPPINLPDPMAMYEMEGNFEDSTGNGYHGTVEGPTAPTFGSNADGMHLSLDGNAGQTSVSLGQATDFAFSGTEQGFSVSLWARSSYAFPSDPALVSNKDWGNGYNQGWVIAAGPNGRWQWNYADGNGTRCDYDGPKDQLNDSGWHNIVASHAFGGNVQLFFDGFLVSTKTCIANMGSIATGRHTTIGTDPSSYAQWFPGDIDKVAIYNEPLSHATVFNLYQAGQGVSFASPSKAPTPPTDSPTQRPSASPSSPPTRGPTDRPSLRPSASPSSSPTAGPTSEPTSAPTSEPTFPPPTASPTASPTSAPSSSPSASPSGSPTTSPTAAPTSLPTSAPTKMPVVIEGACLTSDPLTCGCTSVEQADYRGYTSVTVSNRTCQAWDDHSIHSHYGNTAETRPNAGLESNYCRNPDGEPRAWCYTTDPNVRWELCDVPFCPPACLSDPPNCGCMAESGQADYRGTIALTEGNRTCQAWDDHTIHQHYHNTAETRPNAGLEANYCRNPDGEPRAWCYTTDPNKRWEFCDVPSCPETL